jgi:hypothetical protein
MRTLNKVKALTPLVVGCLLVGVCPVSAATIPTYEWVSKTAQHRKNCTTKYDYCLALKVNQAWIQNCLESSSGDAVYVEVTYLNAKGQRVGSGRDQGGTRIKGALLHFPSANRSVFDSYGNQRPQIFSKVRVESITCISY